MPKSTFIFLLLIIQTTAYSQTIKSFLQLNENHEYKTVKPKKIIETYSHTELNTWEKNVKIFDDSGMLLTEEHFDENDKLETRLTFENDTMKHHKISMFYERWTAIGYDCDKECYSYDAHNFLIRAEDKNVNGRLIYRSEIINNENGNPIEVNGFDINGNFVGKETAVYFYDRKKFQKTLTIPGRQASVDTIVMGQKPDLFYIKNETYNDKGDLVYYENRHFNKTFTARKEEYIYDKKGNCTENKTYEITTKPSGKQKEKLVRIDKKEYFY